MIDLKFRSTQEEIMDDFDCQGEVVHQTLRELHAINTYLGGNAISKNSLKKLISQYPNKTSFSIADLGCGGGDIMMQLADWAERNKKSISFTGVDANPHIVKYARMNCQDYNNIEVLCEDIFGDSFKNRSFDFLHGSLFFHHFQDDDLVKIFSQLKKQAHLAIIFNDLHRHSISYYFTKWLITRWSKSEMVKFDSVVSVARSFKNKELKNILKRAGITNYTLKWKWAFRWELVIYSQ